MFYGWFDYVFKKIIFLLSWDAWDIYIKLFPPHLLLIPFILCQCFRLFLPQHGASIMAMKRVELKSVWRSVGTAHTHHQQQTEVSQHDRFNCHSYNGSSSMSLCSSRAAAIHLGRRQHSTITRQNTNNMWNGALNWLMNASWGYNQL